MNFWGDESWRKWSNRCFHSARSWAPFAPPISPNAAAKPALYPASML